MEESDIDKVTWDGPDVGHSLGEAVNEPTQLVACGGGRGEESARCRDRGLLPTTSVAILNVEECGRESSADSTFKMATLVVGRRPRSRQRALVLDLSVI